MVDTAAALAELSSLTKVQVHTLKTRSLLTAGAINMEEALKSRKTFGISRGTHYRILAQAKKNVIKSLFTVAVAVQMGLLDVSDLQKLVTAVSSVPPEIDPEKLEEVVAIAKTLAERIVMSR